MNFNILRLKSRWTAHWCNLWSSEIYFNRCFPLCCTWIIERIKTNFFLRLQRKQFREARDFLQSRCIRKWLPLVCWCSPTTIWRVQSVRMTAENIWFHNWIELELISLTYFAADPEPGRWSVTDTVKNNTCLIVQMAVRANFTYATSGEWNPRWVFFCFAFKKVELFMLRNTSSKKCRVKKQLAARTSMTMSHT